MQTSHQVQTGNTNTQKGPNDVPHSPVPITMLGINFFYGKYVKPYSFSPGKHAGRLIRWKALQNTNDATAKARQKKDITTTNPRTYCRAFWLGRRPIAKGHNPYREKKMRCNIQKGQGSKRHWLFHVKAPAKGQKPVNQPIHWKRRAKKTQHIRRFPKLTKWTFLIK